MQQVPPQARTTLPLTIDFVPSAGDRFRGAIAESIDPPGSAVDTVPVMVPYVMGGKDEWGDYTGDLCVSLSYTDLPPVPVVQCAPIATMLDADGRLKPISFPEFDPDGLSTGRYEVSAWIPGAERADDTPITVGFRLQSGPPTIGGFTWDRNATAVRFSVTPFSAAAPITGYACRVDGSPVDCPDAASGSWSGALAAGAHTFELAVTQRRRQLREGVVRLQREPGADQPRRSGDLGYRDRRPYAHGDDRPVGCRRTRIHVPVATGR